MRHGNVDRQIALESKVAGVVHETGGTHLILAFILAFAVGVSLTLFGSGGSIITLPMLVYAAGVPPQQAVGMSLAIVGGTTLAATIMNAGKGLMHIKAALLFSGTGIVGALGGAQLTRLVPPPVLMLIFAALMVTVGLLMLRRKREVAQDPNRVCRWQRCAGTGLAVGVITGFIGVGGGFLLVPAMVVFGRLPLKLAIGTSLLVITVNSFSGLAAHFQKTPFDLNVTAMFLGVALLGMFVGGYFSGRVSTEGLRHAFAWFVLAVAVFVIAKSSSSFFKLI